MLIDDAVGKWGVEHQRSKLARTFEHGSMAKVCEEIVKGFYIERQPVGLVPLKDVAQTFSELRQKRETADYDNSIVWTRANTEAWVEKADTAFRNWRSVQSLPEAQDFLLYLFLPKLMPKPELKAPKPDRNERSNQTS